MKTTAYFWDSPEAFQKSGLTRAEWLIANMYFCEAMTLRQIGQALDLSAGRVRQIHEKILARFERHDRQAADDAGDN